MHELFKIDGVYYFFKKFMKLFYNNYSLNSHHEKPSSLEKAVQALDSYFYWGGDTTDVLARDDISREIYCVRRLYIRFWIVSISQSLSRIPWRLKRILLRYCTLRGKYVMPILIKRIAILLGLIRFSRLRKSVY
ncbi:hypothetical protein CpB0184 [Chlamydia pneumoniae TW-183]|uniref:Uncharacterized protein n=2 Tax=Chlamydia pneumoniae TaxID=83558 RepID=Q9Z903_CHLPN|nr:hypothetical protein CPn_0181 [Chlamydia pneumoniae CWL029]AAF38405.1 hypothetical protein CP_0587 [Chlamydia pneumoniae AR39]AAP98117.1 hypothetical protein CpB0184 [Chlamydia pneumoniae TW-183]BAA98391.1 hypothetical protein [Chlamydia pneumoniae J138]